MDVCKYAIRNPVEGAEGKIRLLDVTKAQANKKYDMIVAFDLAEHILKKDWPRLFTFFHESLRPGGFFFLCIATAQNEGERWTHSSLEDPVPADKNWLAVAGHYYIRFMEDWIKDFETNGFVVEYEKMIKFALWKLRHHEMKTADSWGIRNILIGRLP